MGQADAILERLERDGVLTIVSRTIVTGEAEVSVQGSIGRLVEFRGFHRMFRVTAAMVLGTLGRIQEQAWDDGNVVLADSVASLKFDMGSTWSALPVVRRTMRAEGIR